MWGYFEIQRYKERAVYIFAIEEIDAVLVCMVADRRHRKTTHYIYPVYEK
jgi:hypothetical protein